MYQKEGKHISIEQDCSLALIPVDIFDRISHDKCFCNKELPWPSGYELRLSLERSQVLILVKVIVGDRKGIRSKNAHCSSKVPINNWAPS